MSSDDADHAADLCVEEGQSVEDVIAFYSCVRARAACARVIAECELNDVRVSGHGCEVLLRRVLVRMIEWPGRRGGHVGNLRELSGGTAGDRPESAVDEP